MLLIKLRESVEIYNLFLKNSFVVLLLLNILNFFKNFIDPILLFTFLVIISIPLSLSLINEKMFNKKTLTVLFLILMFLIISIDILNTSAQINFINFILKITTILIGLNIVKSKQENIFEEKLEKQKTKKTNFVTYFLLLIFSLTSLYFSVQSLSTFMTVDEPRWINVGNANKPIPQSYEDAFDSDFINSSYARSESYWDAYLSGNFKTTLNNANPSTSLNALHLPAYLLKSKVEYFDYLFLSRISIAVHNIIISLIIFFLVATISSKRVAFMSFTILTLLPQFIGYSRIVNHDSFQGLYIIAFILSLWAGLKNNERKYFIVSGVFYALSLLTQYKSVFLQPLLYLIPIIFFYVYKEKKSLQIFLNNILLFFSSSFIIGVILLPAILFYPQIFIERIFLYNNTLIQISILFSILLFYFIYLKRDKILNLQNKIEVYEKYFVRISIIPIIAILSSTLFFGQKIIEKIHSNNNQYFDSFGDALNGSLATFIFTTHPIILIGLFTILFTFLIKGKINLPYILSVLFFGLLPLIILISGSIRTSDGSGYVLADTRYLYVFMPLLIVAISLLLGNIKNKKFYSIVIILVLSSMIYSNIKWQPFYIMYNNFLTPRGILVQRTTWASDTGETSKYLNGLKKELTIYNPRYDISSLLNKNIRFIQWNFKFWKENPDYIIIEWEKDHQFSPIFDYYRENKTPIWYIKRNDTILTGIYEFDSLLDYEKLLNEK